MLIADDQTVRLRLSAKQSDYLKRVALKAGAPVGVELRGQELEGAPDSIEALRGKLTELLAQRGFTDDYSMNEEGQMIEDLLDVLHLP